MTTYAGEIPNVTTIKEQWAPPYKYAIDSTARTLATNGTGIAAATWSDYTGQPTVTINVSSTGVLMVTWGFEGHNTASAASSLRLGVILSGANTLAGDLNINAMVSTNGGGASTTASKTSSRTHLIKGLAPGATTVKLQAYISSVPAGTTREAVLDNAYLFVTQFYYDGTW